MKNIRFVLIGVALLVAVGSAGYLLYPKKNSLTPSNEKTDSLVLVRHENLDNAQVNDVVEFEGTLVGFNEGCSYDASCVAVVDGYQVVTMTGRTVDMPPVGKSDVWTSDIGKKVKVKAQKVQADVYAIVGSSDYYVLKIEE